MLSSEIDKLVKISIIGSPAVGKTTMLKLLSKETIDRVYLPTHGFDLKTIRFNNYHLKVWDLAGQTNYLKMYLKDYLTGSDLLIIVTDSTPRNVLASRELINYASHFIEKDCPIIAIANKQDLCKSEGRLHVDRVENILHVKTYGLTAIDSSERFKLIQIIEDELNEVLIKRRLKEN
jgi:small GTP-binding protein